MGNMFLLDSFSEIIHEQVTLPDGSKYVGEIKNGKANGKGAAIFPDGKKYVGQYKANRAHGWGKLTWPDGDQYVGEYKKGKASGQGTYYFADGRKYIGEFKNSKFHGQGLYTFPNGREYVGRFDNGEPIEQDTNSSFGGSVIFYILFVLIAIAPLVIFIVFEGFTIRGILLIVHYIFLCLGFVVFVGGAKRAGAAIWITTLIIGLICFRYLI